MSMRVHEPVRWPDLARLWGLQTANGSVLGCSRACMVGVCVVEGAGSVRGEEGHVCLCRCFDIRLCYNHNVFTWSATASAPCTRPVRQVHLICLLNLQNMRRRCRTAGKGAEGAAKRGGGQRLGALSC